MIGSRVFINEAVNEDPGLYHFLSNIISPAQGASGHRAF